jgi:hypothetical protein
MSLVSCLMYISTLCVMVLGCPLECPVVNKHLCNGHGHCAYDTDLRQARCFCDMGTLHCLVKKRCRDMPIDVLYVYTDVLYVCICIIFMQ